MVAYRFSAEHRDEVNPYLNPDNYDADKSEIAGALIQILQKIIKPPAHGRQEGRNRSDCQSYLSHYQEKHNGEIPLWVLTNAMTLGQTFWLYQCVPAKVRGAIAESYENLYADSHRHRLPEKTISVKRLDAIYQRMRQFRNICAHDERLYCAHPHDRNASVWQLIQDFMFVVDKKRYQEFLQKICSLIGYLRKCLPGYWDVIVREMGFTDFRIGDERIDEQNRETVAVSPGARYGSGGVFRGLWGPFLGVGRVYGAKNVENCVSVSRRGTPQTGR